MQIAAKARLVRQSLKLRRGPRVFLALDARLESVTKKNRDGYSILYVIDLTILIPLFPPLFIFVSLARLFIATSSRMDGWKIERFVDRIAVVGCQRQVFLRWLNVSANLTHATVSIYRFG